MKFLKNSKESIILFLPICRAKPISGHCIFPKSSNIVHRETSEDPTHKTHRHIRRHTRYRPDPHQLRCPQLASTSRIIHKTLALGHTRVLKTVSVKTARQIPTLVDLCLAVLALVVSRTWAGKTQATVQDRIRTRAVVLALAFRAGSSVGLAWVAGEKLITRAE